MSIAILSGIKNLVAILSLSAAAALILAPPALAQEIYKTVDENGNTVYTDQKPSSDAEPIQLKELTVVDPVDLGNEAAVSDNESVVAGATEAASGVGLTIVSPADEENVWNTGYVLSVEVAAERELPEETRLAYLIDGEVRTTTRSLSVALEEIYRGEHQLSVELKNSSGEVISRAEPVTFYMRQHSRLQPNPG